MAAAEFYLNKRREDSPIRKRQNKTNNRAVPQHRSIDWYLLRNSSSRAGHCVAED
jgi:hypothetical protein